MRPAQGDVCESSQGSTWKVNEEGFFSKVSVCFLRGLGFFHKPLVFREGQRMYHAEAKTSAELIRRLTKYYLPHGYYFFTTSTVPEHKDVAQVDRNIIEKYGLAISRTARSRNKAKGVARVQYLRHERQVILVATSGDHDFFEDKSVRDCRLTPLPVWYYWITATQKRYRVKVCPESYHAVREKLLRLAEGGKEEAAIEAFHALPWLNYPDIRKQRQRLLKEVTQVLKRWGQASLHLSQPLLK